MSDVDFDQLEEALGRAERSSRASPSRDRRRYAEEHDDRKSGARHYGGDGEEDTSSRRWRRHSPRYDYSPDRGGGRRGRAPRQNRRGSSPSPESPVHRRRFQSPKRSSSANGTLVPSAVGADAAGNDAILEKAKQAQNAERDDLTVLIRNVNPKATERDIWQFVTAVAGKVRDIQIIRDLRSGRSKGVAYVELYTQAGVLSAITLSGTELLGMRVDISPSQAEKNRVCRASRLSSDGLLPDASSTIVVAGLTPPLFAVMDAGDLRELFAPFGAVTQAVLARDEYTGTFRGWATVTFRSASEAAEAVAAMHGYKLGTAVLEVGYETTGAKI